MTAPGRKWGELQLADRLQPVPLVFAILLAIPACAEQRYYTYVGDIQTDSVLLAWGVVDTNATGNTIGRNSTSLGKATIRIDGRTLDSDRNWILVKGLAPDRAYPYEVQVGNRKIGAGTARTNPVKAAKLAFFVIGDYGKGDSKQRRIADAMTAELARRSGSGNPVRFVLTTGDNIYADEVFGFPAGKTGNQDRHWGNKFFEPYQRILAQIPFYPSLGNHDGNESESSGDLEVYLDNFFLPEGRPLRHYSFRYADLAEFFALDSTQNSDRAPLFPAYSKEGLQFAWLQQALKASTVPWKIPFFHHPPFTAGPRHAPMLEELRHFVDLFPQQGVAVAFNGHEHNLQISERNRATGGVAYIVSGAGGELRGENISSRMAKENIAGWAPQRHFLVVEIEARTMRIQPVSDQPVVVKDKDGRAIPLPLVVELR